MKLIVGLGNPGKEYENTRHNSGYMFVDYFAKKYNLNFKEKMDAFYAETIICGEKVIFIKPTTFMNLSGTAVKKYVDFYKININDVLVIYDDTSFEVGKIKIKPAGSSGGHNGINDIINKLKTEEIKRVKVGISKNPIDLSKYVLSNFNKEDKKLLDELLTKCEMLIEDFVNFEFDRLMSKYNI